MEYYEGLLGEFEFNVVGPWSFSDVDEETKKAHVEKMSKAMKEAWDRGEEDFGPRIANKENVKFLLGNMEIEDNLPRINDYCGVLTESQLGQLDA